MNRKQRRAGNKRSTGSVPGTDLGAAREPEIDAIEEQPSLSQTIQALFADAFRHHQAGRLSEAELLYRQILQIDARHADSLHMSGLLAFQSGKSDVAVDLISKAIEQNGDIAVFHGHLGSALAQQGKLEAAMASFRRALSLKTDYFEAHYNLAKIFEIQGNLAEALGSYQRALTYRPNFADALLKVGFYLSMQGRLQEALASFDQALAVRPNDTEAHYRRGLLLAALGRWDLAVDSLRRAVTYKPDFAEAHSSLGRVLRDQGRLEEAIEAYGQVLRYRPDHAPAHFNLGDTLQMAGKLDEAIASYGMALVHKPDYAEAHGNLGVALAGKGQLAEAVASYGRALFHDPNYAEAHSNLGNALQALGNLDAAVASYSRALHYNPKLGVTYFNLGNVLKEQGKLDDAVASYKKALACDPNYAEAYNNLGNTLATLGHADEAIAHYQRALGINPRCLSYAVHAYLQLPIILDSEPSISTWRERYREGIAALSAGRFDDSPDRLDQHSFHLAYQNRNDKSLMLSLSRMFSLRVPRLTAPHLAGRKAPAAAGRRLRIGVLSCFLVGHTIGKLFQGFIQHLDRSRFEVIVIHSQKAKHDLVRQAIDALADEVIVLPTGLKKQQHAVLAANLDVLFYTDIGMEQETYFLSYARLAPVQAVFWGHPVTTGIENIDYFISAESIEPPEADDHYSEHLIRLTRLPCYYAPVVVPRKVLTRKELALPETGTLYGCPQSLFKFHPDFDSILAAIAEGDPEGHIVLVEWKYPSITELLKARWARRFPGLNERVVFVPRVSSDRFLDLIAHIDVLLDPIHFGSGNTMYEAMLCGTPIVTWAGEFMRGRLVAACYRQMRIENPPIAKTLFDYANTALELGRDPAARETLRNQLIDAARRELFADLLAVRELEVFILEAADAAEQGKKLPLDWRPKLAGS